MMQKIIKIGNSKGIILSKELLDILKIQSDQAVSVETDEATHAIIITKNKNVKKNMAVSPYFLSILAKVNKEYGPALKKLAKL